MKEADRQINSLFKDERDINDKKIFTLFREYFPREEEEFIESQIKSIKQPYNKKDLGMSLGKTHLKIHEILLKDFIVKFSSYDRDDDGILSKS